jgi:2-dehydropantoate 2-reductase
MGWHILGVGSIGGLWASYLALAGEQATLLLRDSKTLRQYQAAPLQLESDSGFEYPQLDVSSVEDLATTIDCLLVTTKSFSTLEALRAVEYRFSSDTKILLLQNGMGFQQSVVRRYPELEVIGGITTDGAYRRSRFHVVHAGKGISRFGALSPVSEKTINRLRECFDRLPLTVQWVDDIQTPMWHKVGVNACINALTAIHRCRNGELLKDEKIVQYITELALETEQVMRAVGIVLPAPGLLSQVVDVIEVTADNYSSMYQDVIHGRQTEIEYINGFICEQGESPGVETTLNRELLETVLAGAVGSY